MENVAKKKRIILDIPEEARKDLDDMVRILPVRSKTELVRYALGLMVFLVKRKKEGYEILVRKGDETSRLVMPFLGFND